MKSLFLFASLLLLASCGKEQFGTAAQTESTQTDALKSLAVSSCSSHTLVKPKVDILYVVDNSESTSHMNSDIKNSIKNTVNSISSQFDYRVIGIPLVADLSNTSTYQVLSQDPTGIPHTSNIIIKTSELNFFTHTESGIERGLNRIKSFIDAHKNSGLFRKGAHHLIVLISNGRDEEIETAFNANGETTQNTAIFNQRLAELRNLRTALQSSTQPTQFRLLSATASAGCTKSGWRSSERSYQAMSKQLYIDSGATDNPSYDIYNLCSSAGVSNLFSSVNNSIQQVVVPHGYRYWHIPFAENNPSVDPTKVKVYKFVPGSAPAPMNNSEWSYYENSGTQLNTRENPTPGEAVVGKHFIRFNNLLTYPSCVQISATTRTEYFHYVVLPRAPKKESIIVRVNGQNIPSSALTYLGYKSNENIKVEHNGSTLTPEVKQSGYFIKITNSNYYYKSGDNLETFYTPDAI